MPAPRVYENASVLFMDIVSYSKQTVDQQVKLISLLQSAVNQSAEFQRANETDLIKLPTGDGMALVFTRDLVSPVRCALEIAEAIQVGDGINIAQRVMDSGDAGHILLSSTMAENLQRLSADWPPCLKDLGMHEVKHGVQAHL